MFGDLCHRAVGWAGGGLAQIASQEVGITRRHLEEQRMGDFGGTDERA